MGRLKRGRLDDLAEVLRPGETAPVGTGRGYFKLKRAERRDPDFPRVPLGQPRLLVASLLLPHSCVWSCFKNCQPSRVRRAGGPPTSHASLRPTASPDGKFLIYILTTFNVLVHLSTSSSTPSGGTQASHASRLASRACRGGLPLSLSVLIVPIFQKF